MQRDGGPGGAGGGLSEGSFTGPAETLELVGNHAYAFSGLNVSSATPITVFSFTTGNYYTVGEFQINAGYDDDDAAASAAATLATIKFNGTSIAIIGCGGATPDRRPSSITQAVVIPPYTEIECTIDSVDEADQYNSMTFVGRIYRG